MVDFLCLSLVLPAFFHLPLAFTLPRGNTDGAAGDLTGAMVALSILFKRFTDLHWCYNSIILLVSCLIAEGRECKH